MTLANNGNGLRTSSLRISLPTLGAISSIVGVVIFISGWVIGYMTFKADLKTVTENVIVLRTENGVFQTRISALGQTITEDRQAISGRLTVLEVESKYISQGIGELKSAVVPKR